MSDSSAGSLDPVQFAVPLLRGGGTASTVLLSGVDLIASRQPLKSAIVGLEIPWFPDFLADPRFSGKDRATAIVSFLDSWQQQIATLWQSQNTAFSLRFEWQPARASISAALLIRITAPESRLAQEVRVCASLMSAFIASFGLPAIPLTQSAVADFLMPSFVRSVTEIHQKEQLFPIRRPDGIVDAYAVLPFYRAQGDWVGLLHAMQHSATPLLINLHLQPTILLSQEREALSHAAHWAKNHIEIAHSGRTTRFDIKNPHAETVYRIYSALDRRLTEPFVIVAQVCTTDARSAAGVAERLGQETVTRLSGTLEEEAEEIPVGFQCVEDPRGVSQHTSSLLRQMWFEPNPFSAATQGKERLPYLVDARGAAALFRLPIPSEVGLPGIEVRRQRQGFNAALGRKQRGTGLLLLGRTPRGEDVTFPVGELTRHALICGLPGSGKTNTSLSILHQLWTEHRIPFWVFEPPKTEYRGLLEQPGFEDALVFSLGDEATAPFRINPFELMPEVSVEEHVAKLRLCFEAGMPSFGDGSGLIGMFMDRAIREAYQRKRWRTTDTAEAGHEFPVMGDLQDIIKQQLATYSGDVKQNLEASMSNRISGLLRGSKGRMFNVSRGASIEDLMGRPVIFELLPMGPDAPLALMFLLTFLQEYAANRERKNPLGIEHVTLVEEAHVVMSATGDEGAAGHVAAAFENMLAELRASGEGIIIAEQSPTKLLKGAIDLTNLKIVHRLASPGETAAVGGAMIATEKQRESIQVLDVGEAAIIRQGMQGLGYMHVPNFKDAVHFQDRMTKGALRQKMQPYYEKHPQLRFPFHGCIHCKAHQDFRKRVGDALSESGALYTMEPHIRENTALPEYLKVAALAGVPTQREAAWCAYVQVMDYLNEDFLFPIGARRTFDRMYDTERGAD